MTPQSGQQAITTHILPSTSRSENNQAMKFGLVIENNKKTFLIQKPCREGATKTSSRPLFVF